MIRLTKPRLILAVLAVAFVGSCSGGLERPSVNLQIFDAMRQNLGTFATPRKDPAPVTRADLDRADRAYLEVTMEARDIRSYLEISDRLNDHRPGELVVWRNIDGSTMTMREGVLIQTRGIGGDLYSNDVVVSARRPGPLRGGARTLRIRALDNKVVPLLFDCELTDLGQELLEVVELKYQTRHLRESCVGEDGSFANDFWIDVGAGLVWQSRQWAGPEIGYILTRRLTL